MQHCDGDLTQLVVLTKSDRLLDKNQLKTTMAGDSKTILKIGRSLGKLVP